MNGTAPFAWPDWLKHIPVLAIPIKLVAPVTALPAAHAPSARTSATLRALRAALSLYGTQRDVADLRRVVFEAVS